MTRCPQSKTFLFLLMDEIQMGVWCSGPPALAQTCTKTVLGPGVLLMQSQCSQLS